MRIEIWSDVVCPWCYIGKRRLETALAGFEHRDDVEVVYRSFQLDPSAPNVPVQTVAESLGQKYGGGPEAGQQMVDRVEAVAAEEGLLFRLGEAQRVGTVDAHRLLHLALELGGPSLQSALKEELLAAYFLRAENVADHDLLRRTAEKVGLAANRVEEVLVLAALRRRGRVRHPGGRRARCHRGAVLRGRPQVRHLRGPAGGGVRPGARPGLDRGAPAAERRGRRHRRR